VVALESTSAIVPQASVQAMVQATKDQMLLEYGVLSYEISFHSVVDTMKRDEQADLVFSCFGIRKRNEIGIEELDVGLQQLRAASKHDYPSAHTLVETFASRRRGDLIREDFEPLIEGLAASSINCSFEDMCHLLLQHSYFRKSGSSIVEETVRSIAGQSRYKVDEAITEARLVLLFKAMDVDNGGAVQVREVSKALSPLIEKVSDIERESLLTLRYRVLRKLDYELFSEHIMDVFECLSGVSINELANELTVGMTSGDDIDDANLLDSSSSLGSIGSLESLDFRRSDSSSSFSFVGAISTLFSPKA
jgi:hypothetical protein